MNNSLWVYLMTMLSFTHGEIRELQIHDQWFSTPTNWKAASGCTNGIIEANDGTDGCSSGDLPDDRRYTAYFVADLRYEVDVHSVTVTSAGATSANLKASLPIA